MKTVVSTIALAATVLVAAGADAAMCVKRSGAVVVRDACRKKETPISTADFVGAPGAPGEDGADGGQGPRGEKGDQGDPGGLRVVDATGRVIGALSIGHSDSIAVSVPNVGVGIVYSDTQDPTGFWQGDASLYHEASACQGTPLVEVSKYDLVPYLGAFAGSAYFPGSPEDMRTVASREYASNSCSTTVTTRGLCCEDLSSPSERRVAPAIAVPLTSLGTPPFTVAE